MSAPRAILFDWDHTLVDNWGAIQTAINAALSAFDLPNWDRDETLRRVRASMRDSFPELFGEEWPRARDIFYETFEARHLETLRELPGALSCLDVIGAASIPCGVVSNKRGSFLRTEVEALGWTPRFGAILGAGDAERDKPDPAAALMALERLGVAPGRDVWFVGDTETDVDCADAAGLTPFLVAGTPGVSARPAARPLADLYALTALIAAA